jgi:hypothetical protein
MSAEEELQASQAQGSQSVRLSSADGTLAELLSKITTTPTPIPTPQGGGEYTEFAA